MLTTEEYQKIRQFIEEKALALMQHEEKGYAWAGFSIDKWKRYQIKGRTFYCVKSNTFKALLETHIVNAQKKFPEKFGTGNAMDVIEAIYNIEPIFTPEQFLTFLINEQPAYILEIKDEEVINKMLRIDLFRKLDDKNGKKEFTGGLFHCFKHFSINNINLSTGNEINNIQYPEEILHLAVEAFFISEVKPITPEKFVSYVRLDEKYNLKFVFYFEANSKVYFIKTIHKEGK